MFTDMMGPCITDISGCEQIGESSVCVHQTLSLCAPACWLYTVGVRSSIMLSWSPGHPETGGKVVK